MDLVGPSEFAKRKGVSNTLVFRALGNGRIKYHEGTKKIDWDTQSEAFDNNCNLKFKMAARTRGDLQRAIVAGTVQSVAYVRPEPAHVEKPAHPAPKDKPVETPKPEPKPTPAPAPKQKPEPKEPKPVPERTQREIEDEEAKRQAAKERDTYNKARTAEQVFKAQIIELEVRQKRGELMPVSETRKAVQKMAEFVKKGFDGLADRISDELAGMNDPHEIHSLLIKEHNSIFQELSNASAKFGS